jgi:tRNA 2-thiouridine synthesizing protein A
MMTHTINARNLLCPMPVIRLQDTLKHLPIGDCVTIMCTDPGVRFDIPAWCDVHGHTLLSIEEDDVLIILKVRKN